MSDNLRRYRATRDALTQCYPGQPSGTVARHVITLAALISGIVGRKSTQLPHVAANVPDGTKPQDAVREACWSLACGTATSTVATWGGATFRLDALGS